MAEQAPEGSALTHLSLDDLGALIAVSQKQLAGVNELLADR
ncbi:hypothetical protein [Kocuria sp. BT304]|nr:hypothetical protein [Kocuria sp. BT304]